MKSGHAQVSNPEMRNLYKIKEIKEFGGGGQRVRRTTNPADDADIVKKGHFWIDHSSFILAQHVYLCRNFRETGCIPWDCNLDFRVITDEKHTLKSAVAKRRKNP